MLRKSSINVLILLMIIFCLSGCASIFHQQETPSHTTNTQSNNVPTSDTLDTSVTTDPTLSTTNINQECEHSPLYIPDMPVEDVIMYFNEVCLDAEFVFGGDPSRLQKWVAPINYTVNGNPTDEDIDTLNLFTAWLNTVEGYPGIYEAQDPYAANLQIYFCTQEEMLNKMGDNFINMDGGVTFWYLDDKIYEAIICYRTDLDQQLRNSVILEEVYNGLGPIQDTNLRPDSIIYQEFSQNQWLSPIDELILRLLYHPDIQPGMNAQECEQIIRSIYY